jgi:hypothetical protein
MNLPFLLHGIDAVHYSNIPIERNERTRNGISPLMSITKQEAITIPEIKMPGELH